MVRLDQRSLPGMRLFSFRPDITTPVFGGRPMYSNRDKFIRPFESMHFSANFSFSHGHFLKNVGY